MKDGKRSRSVVRIDIPSEQSVVTLKRYPKEKKKTVIAFLLLSCNFVLATLSLALTHERLPDRETYKPLPDIILDNVTPQDWALYVSDILVASSVMATSVVMLLHRHRYFIYLKIIKYILLGLSNRKNNLNYCNFQMDCLTAGIPYFSLFVLDAVIDDVCDGIASSLVHVSLLTQVELNFSFGSNPSSNPACQWIWSLNKWTTYVLW